MQLHIKYGHKEDIFAEFIRLSNEQSFIKMREKGEKRREKP